MALPSIQVQKSEAVKQISFKLDSILQDCDHLGMSSKLYNEINRIFVTYNLNLEQLKQLKTIAASEKPKTSKKLEKYIKCRFKSTGIPLASIINTEASGPNLTFKSFDQSEMNHDLIKQKRKFGEFWNRSDLCFKSSESAGVEMRKLEKEVKREKPINSGRFDLMIKEIMCKKLGLHYKTNPKVQRKKEFSKKESSRRAFSILRKSLDVTGTEDEYLRHEYNQYINNTPRKLKLEKIIFKQHQKNRKLHFLVEN